MPKRQRNYQAEYQARIRRGLSAGLTRRQARGKPGYWVLPDGTRGWEISARELKEGRLLARTVETMNRVNRGLGGRSAGTPERWRLFCQSRGWVVYQSKRTGNWYTQDDVPSSIIEALGHGERKQFYGY